LSYARYRDAPHRAPVKLIGVDIAAELGYPDVGQAGQSAWLEELLRRFRQGHSGDTKVSIIDRMKQHWDDPSHAAAVQLLASCIFFAVNSWDSARLCAKLCLAHVQDKKHRKLWMREARYCEALAIRMQLSSRAQINDAINFLNKNMANQPDKLAMMRDGVERSTLILTAAIVQKIEDGLPVIDTQTPFIALLPVDGLEAEVAEALAELEEILVQDGRSNDKPLSETSERILLQAQINVLGASIFAKTVGMPIPVHYGEHEKLQEAVRGLRSRIKASNIKPSMTANIYLLAGQALLEPLQINVEAVLALLRSIDPKDNSLTRADIREIVYLANHFENLANSPSSVGDVNSPSLK